MNIQKKNNIMYQNQQKRELWKDKFRRLKTIGEQAPQNYRYYRLKTKFDEI